ncbi:protein-L-isoaspartate(D-aspartate) O-methyltransferase [Candidatus Woesearchaeota archaeon]|nr:MAG: protein-L-isoaspartate(D-aspartate) O-methyltransferase [Candidatus Woesearchaeota archaeon]
MIPERVLLAEKWRRMGISQKVIDAFMEVPREHFVPPELKDEAYADYPLPIGEGQTISQPTTVAMMLDWLNVRPNDKVLEIGTGSGYNAALLSKLARKAITVERIPALAEQAKKKLEELNIKNVTVVAGDGTQGFPEEAPYDRIIVTAAAEEGVPQALEEQLADNGIIVVPVGYGTQRMLVGKKKNGRISYSDKGAFVFVPLV